MAFFFAPFPPAGYFDTICSSTNQVQYRAHSSTAATPPIDITTSDDIDIFILSLNQMDQRTTMELSSPPASVSDIRSTIHLRSLPLETESIPNMNSSSPNRESNIRDSDSGDISYREVEDKGDGSDSDSIRTVITEEPVGTEGSLEQGQKAARKRREMTSWTWGGKGTKHGRRSEFRGDIYWICLHCPNSKNAKRYLVSGGSAVRAEHLRQAPNITENMNKKQLRLQRSQQTIQQAIERAVTKQSDTSKQEHSHIPDINKDVLHDLLIRLISQNNLPLSFSTSNSLLDLLQYIRPTVGNYLPVSPQSAQAWLMNSYTKQKANTGDTLQRAQSAIHLTVDTWTSPNNLALLGVIAHFTAEDGELRHLLLGLREIIGAHTGDNFASIIIQLLDEYAISSKLGYLMMDNASNNDTLCVALSNYMSSLGVEWCPIQHRLRCNGHIINLSVQAFLFGDSQAIWGDSQQAGESRIAMAKWRKHGALGKAHNIIVHIRQNPQRQQDFKARSDGILSVRDNDTRWNSWYDLLQSILLPKAHETIDLYVYHYGLEEDRLSKEDWLLLQEIHTFLHSFKTATLYTESRTASLSHIIPSLDYLIAHYKASIAKYINSKFSPYMVPMLEHGLLKLEKYFDKTSTLPTYIAAVILNPRWKWSYFEKRWSGPNISGAKERLNDYWNSQYRGNCSLPNRNNMTDKSGGNEFEVWCQLEDLGNQNIDEYESYSSSGLELEVGLSEARQWWMHPKNRARYPHLSRMSIDILSIPAMSAEPERLFSSAKLALTSLRSRLKDGTIEALECLKSWDRA